MTYWFEYKMRTREGIAVYIMASGRNGTLYIGVTSDIIRRGWQHKSKETEGFTKKYHVTMLVYYELHESMESAIHREKRLKKYTRNTKLALIEKMNPDWKDLYGELIGCNVAEAV